MSAIACISAFVFIFHQTADSLSFHCLKTAVANTAFETKIICAEGLTDQRWQMLSDYSVMILVAFPSIIYIIARRTAALRSIGPFFESLATAGLSITLFNFARIFDESVLWWFCVVALPIIAFVIAKSRETTWAAVFTSSPPNSNKAEP